MEEEEEDQQHQHQHLQINSTLLYIYILSTFFSLNYSSDTILSTCLHVVNVHFQMT